MSCIFLGTVNGRTTLSPDRGRLVHYMYVCRGEWEKLFQPDGYMRQLRHYGMNGKLRSTRFRSICWKVSFNAVVVHRITSVLP